MTLRLKIFIALFIIVSTTMLLSYLYGISLVEIDRRNFINEFIENKADSLRTHVSFSIDSILLLSKSLCLTTTNSRGWVKRVEEVVKEYLSSNEYVEQLYYEKDNIRIRYNLSENNISMDGSKRKIINGYIEIANSEGDCVFVSRLNIGRLINKRSDSEDVILFFQDMHYSTRDITKLGVSNLRDKVAQLSKSSLSGVFTTPDFVLGYSYDRSNDIALLYLIKREMFEKAIISLRYRIFVAGLFTLIVFLSAGYVIAGKISKPMVLLKEKAQLIKKGVFEKIEAPHRTDEIGDAISAFNKMVDDLREKEENLKESQMKLVQAEKMSAFGQLSAGIAHEVKNPLTSVLGYIQLARRFEKDEKIIDYLKIAENETLRCKQILEDLLKFARMDRHQKTELDLSEVVNNTIRLVNHQMAMKKIKLLNNVGSEKITIMGNANQLQQVFLNILLNAMQSIERKGNNDGVIVVSLGREKDFSFVSIRDNGEGIPDENLQKIYEPFFTTKADMGGTGLGLSISFGIIKEHNGDIKVNSRVGEGTEFKVYLPI
ncbi:MAG: ATP-binding protein [Deltaproteobacteria bacterium]|nr:ATP-binding protein [Deltaproteobacteria bacterium]